MKIMRFASIIPFLGLAIFPHTSLADDVNDFSRSELFSIPRFIDGGLSNYSLPKNFSFPQNAREGSTFGIDVSHHVQDDCKCEIDWHAITDQKVSFVYAKATEGSTYFDRTATKDIAALAAIKSVDFGVFHFLSSGDDPSKQASWFLSKYKALGRMTLPPSLDLEWDLGSITPECPNDAIVRVKRDDGTVKQYCDRWYKYSNSQIIAAANTVIDAMRNETGQEPLLYTNAAWFQQRIGTGDHVHEIHTKLIWIADYSKDGLATEKPRVPGNENFVLWQFSEHANITSNGKQLSVDASIFEGSRPDFQKQLKVGKMP